MSTMVEVLRRIIDSKGAGCPSGLCRELLWADDVDPDRIDALFETWEHFSGCVTHPVPDPERPWDPAAASTAFYLAGEGGQFVGAYGELRLKLAAHLLEALELG